MILTHWSASCFLGFLLALAAERALSTCSSARSKCKTYVAYPCRMCAYTQLVLGHLQITACGTHVRYEYIRK